MATSLQRRRKRPRLGKVVARASVSPLNIGVAGGAAVAALALGSWPILALGGAAYAALVAFDAANPSFWQRVYGRAAVPPRRLPDPESLRDPATKDAVVRLQRARGELDRVLRETPDGVTRHLGSTLTSLEMLEAQAGRMAERAEEIARHLATIDEPAVRADAARLGERAKTAEDTEARARFAEARAARDDELRSLSELRRAKERVDANLLRLVTVVSGLPTKVVHMRTLDADAVDQLSGGVQAELEAVGRELGAFEDVLRSLGEVPE
jgi:hypothetical protein